MLPLTPAEWIASRNWPYQDILMMFYAFPPIVAHSHRVTVISKQVQYCAFVACRGFFLLKMLRSIFIHCRGLVFVFERVSVARSAFMLDLCIESVLRPYMYRNAHRHTRSEEEEEGVGCLRGQWL